jgi:hypothetical protein
MAYSSFSTSPNSQSYGAIQNQSFYGMGPGYWNHAYPENVLAGGDPQAAFNARNYAPKPAPTQPTPTPSGAGQPTQGASNLPSSLLSALQISAPQAPGGLGTYQTGIKSGLLPQATVDASKSALKWNGGQAPTAAGTPTSSPARAGLNSTWNDLMTNNQATAGTELDRDASYMQNQMQLAQQKALANAAVGGYKFMLGQYDDQVGNDLAKRSLLMQALGMLG